MIKFLKHLFSKKIRNYGVVYGVSFFDFIKDPSYKVDEALTKHDLPSDAYIKYTLPDTPMERIKKMYSFDAYGNPSPQMYIIEETAYLCFYGGLILSMLDGLRASRNRRKDIKHRKFLTLKMAKEAYFDFIVLEGMKTFFRQTGRLMLISTLTGLLVFTIGTYRGDFSLIDLPIAAGLTFGLLRLKHGTRFFLSGSLIGAWIGMIFGSILKLCQVLNELTLEDILDRISQVKWEDYQRKLQRLKHYQQSELEKKK